MIQRTAIWILATLAFCSPGVAWFESATTSDGSGQIVQSFSGSAKTAQSANLRNRPRQTENAELRYEVSDSVHSTVDRLYLGSLYNRPPPSLRARS